jgi:Predicted carbamoyl transferase, NodU family
MHDVDTIAYPDTPFRTGPNSQIAEMSAATLERMIAGGSARRRSMTHKHVLDAANTIGLSRDAGMHPMVKEGFEALENRYGKLPSVKFFGHHLAHAAASYLTSGFDDSAVVTIDGRGGPLSAASWHANAAAITKLSEEPYTNSLGWFYRDCTRFAGLGDFGEGKLMGLAPYGHANAEIMAVDRMLDTANSLPWEYRAKPSQASMGFSPRQNEDVLAEPWPDFAAGVQHALERAYERAARSAIGSSHSRKLCVGGGVALNCSANGRLLAESIADDVWLFPASGDAGLSVGAALLCARDAGELEPRRIESPYWGPQFSEDDIEAVLRTEPALTFEKPANLSAHVAEALAHGKVVGWFQGRMELGPRALGNRSILADPRTIAMRDKVNRVKRREMWRPLAPSVMAERAAEYFEIVPPNAFMLFATQAKGITRECAPAIVHVDGSARPQPVSRALNAPFYDLLAAFDAIAGVPILLNTSFNAAGEPIVCTPRDAVNTFKSTGLDMLAIGPYVVRTLG